MVNSIARKYPHQDDRMQKLVPLLRLEMAHYLPPAEQHSLFFNKTDLQPKNVSVLPAQLVNITLYL